MAIADTMDFDEMVLEVEFDPEGAAGTYNRICAMIDISWNRSKNVSTDEIPDCADESLPFHIRRFTTSIDITASGTGKWSMAFDKRMKDWFYNDTTLNVRLRSAKVEADGSVGDYESEAVPMKLLNLSNSRTKGQTVAAEIEIGRDGPVTLNAKIA
jgi:hypothetical protein